MIKPVNNSLFIWISRNSSARKKLQTEAPIGYVSLKSEIITTVKEAFASSHVELIQRDADASTFKPVLESFGAQLAQTVHSNLMSQTRQSELKTTAKKYQLCSRTWIRDMSLDNSRILSDLEVSTETENDHEHFSLDSEPNFFHKKF